MKMEFNENIAEIVGIVLGDGHIHTKSNLLTITGSLEELDYYQKHVSILFQKEFKKTPYLKKRKDRNAYYLMICSKEIIDYLVNELRMKRGSKYHAVIPNLISSKKEFMGAFLRGIFDTDGCIKFSKQNRNINYYPRIEISLRESPLARELKILLENLNISFCSWKDERFNHGQRYFQISGKVNARRWFKEISPKNQVHTSKYYFWKKEGYCIPRSSLKFRTSHLASTKPKIL